jgi:hypothetical protein
MLINNNISPMYPLVKKEVGEYGTAREEFAEKRGKEHEEKQKR